jgi:starch synthase
MKNILIVASEAVPFVKTGGLADVVGSLPKYFNKDEFDVRVVIPNYMCIPYKFKEIMKYKTHFGMDLSWRRQYVGIMEAEYEGIKYYFIDNEYYFAGNTPYGMIYEDIEKFAFFAKAVLSILPSIDFKPDIIHCNDWQTGLIPVFLKAFFMENNFYANIKTIMTIHNIKFQGKWDIKKVRDITGLSEDFFTPDKLEAYGDANYLKGGLVYADYITTVSETYVSETMTSFFGEGLEGLLCARRNSYAGIINGIDYVAFNPETDKHIFQHYNADTFEQAKAKNKLELQKELGLELDENKFMIGMVGRLTDQKGLDLIKHVMEEICSQDVQFVILGTGEQRYEDLFRYYEYKYKGRVSGNIYYSEQRANRIYAASDVFLMPSLFEPCGLSQLISLRYGSVPIVRETGGLKDTVVPYNEYEDTGIGFSFTNYNAHDMLYVINYAKHLYYNNKTQWNRIVERGMNTNYSWKNSAEKYEQLYKKL